MMLRVDVERLNAGMPHWTVVLSGPTLDQGHAIRVDARSLGVGIAKGLQRLRECAR